MQQIIELFPPLVGAVIDITDVPDQVFSSKMLGAGIAIDPLENKIYAPISGVIKSVHLAKHAITIECINSFDILIHIGLDSVNLKGKGFNIFVKDGDLVKSGQILGEFDLDYIALNAKSLISPIILLDFDAAYFSITNVAQKFSNLATPIMLVTQYKQKNKPIINKSTNLITSEVITIQNSHGIHARPAAILSAIARNYAGDVLIEKNGKRANLKSIISILELSIEYKDKIQILASTENEIKAILEAINKSANKIEILKEEVLTSNKSLPKKIIDNKYFGISASDGLTSGKLIKIKRMQFEIKEKSTNISVEKNRFETALDKAKKDIEYHLSTNNQTQDLIQSNIMTAHLQIVTDPQIIGEVFDLISEGKTAEFALQTIINAHCQILEKTKNQLIIERQSDLRDVENRVLSVMPNVVKKETVNLNNENLPTILLADDLLPSDLLNLNKNIVGLVSVKGGVTSHVSIIAKMKKLPFLIGVDESILNLNENIDVVLNAEKGFLNTLPSKDELIEVEASLKKTEEQQKVNLRYRDKIAATIDGITINCLGNIGSLIEANDVLYSGADGVGLFRTEFIFLDRSSAPSIRQQEQIYESIANKLNDKPFMIRILDGGGDKAINYLNIPHEDNPALGLRGIRLCLEYKELLVNQLTAILRVFQKEKIAKNIKIMLPMVATIEEYCVVKEIINQIKEDLNILITPPLGIMVEVPSVALMSDVFAKEVDFFSIGTNDLTQYILAFDRNNSKVSDKLDHFHPAVIRAIGLVVKAAQLNKKPVSVCGLMASEKLAIPILIGLGVRELSMNLNNITDNKALISRLEHKKCEQIVSRCLNFSSSFEVRQLLSTEFAEELK